MARAWEHSPGGRRQVLPSQGMKGGNTLLRCVCFSVQLYLNLPFQRAGGSARVAFFPGQLSADTAVLFLLEEAGLWLLVSVRSCQPHPSAALCRGSSGALCQHVATGPLCSPVAVDPPVGSLFRSGWDHLTEEETEAQRG